MDDCANNGRGIHFPLMGVKPVRSKIHRFEALDYVRGFASLIVLVCHILYLGHVMDDPAWDVVRWLPINLIWSGGEAVILFFVLSGFALFLLYESFAGRPLAAPIFILSRWIRLYPVYLLSIVFAIAAYAALAEGKDEIDTFVPAGKVTVSEVLQHLFVVGNPNTFAYNPPVWSIVYELRFSILFPLMFPLIMRLGLLAGFLSSMLSLSIAGMFFLGVVGPTFHTAAGQLLGTLYYAVYFVFGALLASHREQLALHLSRLDTLRATTMLCLCLFVFCYAVPIGRLFIEGPRIRWREMLMEFLVGLSACGIIALAVARPPKRRYLVLNWFGSISFSLYLTHYTVINVINILLGRHLNQIVLFPIHFAGSIAVAYLVWKILEVPSLMWSRYIFRERREQVPVRVE